MSTEKKIALVTGANRGIGFAIAKELAQCGHHVLMGVRNLDRGQGALQQILSEKRHAELVEIDVASEESIRDLFRNIDSKFGKLDILVNNAGVLLDRDHGGGNLFETSVDTIRATLETNVFGPFMLSQLFVPGMLKRNYGRVVNISSGMGQLSEMGGGFPAYRISKTSLNAVTRIFAAEAHGKDVLINSMCPGWVKTDMGGAGADRPPEKGAETAVWLSMLPSGGPSGMFFRDKTPIPW